MKFVGVPIYRIILNVFRNTLKRFIISDNMIVKTGLPTKISMNFTGMNGANPFILINYYYPMHVIGHYNKFAQFNEREMGWYFLPKCLDNCSDFG